MSKKRTKSLPPQQVSTTVTSSATPSASSGVSSPSVPKDVSSSSHVNPSSHMITHSLTTFSSSSSDQPPPIQQSTPSNFLFSSPSSPIPIQNSQSIATTGRTSSPGSSGQPSNVNFIIASSSPAGITVVPNASPKGGEVALSSSSSLTTSDSSLMIHSPLLNQQQVPETTTMTTTPSPQKIIYSFSQQQLPTTTSSGYKNVTPPSAFSSASLDAILKNATTEMKQMMTTHLPMIAKPLTFNDLPNDLIHYIICFLELKDFLSCRLTNRVFHILAENEWQRHYRAVWEVPHRLVFWDIDTPMHQTSRQSLFVQTSPCLHSTKNHQNEDMMIASRFSRIHHQYNGNMVTWSQRKTMFFSTPGSISTTSILDYNNPWKDLFIERYRIIHDGNNASSKRKLGIFSSRQTSSEDYVEKGYRCVYRNEYSKAIHYFEKAISLSKEGCARAWEGLAKICWIRDLPQYVIVYAEEALKNNPVNPGELFFIRGKALLKLNRIVEALPDLTKAVNFLTMSPVNYHLFLKISEVYYERMMCHIELGNIDQALADGETIMTTDKCFETDCFFKAAKILFEKQQYEDAEKFMTNSYVKKTPDYYLLYLQIKSANGSYQEALEYLKKFEELEAKKRSNTINNSATALTKESLIEIGIVLLMNDCINEAVEYFTKGALLRSAASQTNNTASPPNSSSSDDLIFNSLMRRSSLSFAFSSHKIIDEEATQRAKLFVIDAATRQKKEYSSYFGTDLKGDSYFDIHMAWSYYYYLLAMLYYCRNTITFNGAEKGRYSASFSTRSTATQLMSLTSQNNEELGSSRLILLIKGQKNYIYQQRKLTIRFVNEHLENDLKHSITNLTRSITLNPTLCEGFYYRSLMKCFLQIDNHLMSICSSPMFGSTLTQNGIVSFLIEKFKKKKSPQKDAITGYKKHKKMHKNISDKINVVTHMREALNDCENAFTLITMELRINTVDELEEIDFKSNNDISTIDLSTKSRKHTELLVDILLLRAFLFYCFGKSAECAECTNLACYLCNSVSTSSTPSENVETTTSHSNTTSSISDVTPSETTTTEGNSQQENDHIMLENITFERQLLAGQGLFALNEDFEALKEMHPRFLTMRNDAIQRHVDQLIMNFIIEPEYSYISQQLDYMLVIIHSQLLQKDLQNNSSSDKL